MTKPASLLVTLAALAAGCATPVPGVDERLDPQTAVTTTCSNIPLTFYDDRSGVAAYAKGLVNMGGLEVNRMGEHRYYLWLAIWSTVHVVDEVRQRNGFETIYLYVDGQPFELDVQGWSPDSIGASQSPCVKPVSTAAEAYYPVTRDQINLIAYASSLSLRTSGDISDSYELWDDQSAGRESFARFLAFVQDRY